MSHKIFCRAACLGQQILEQLEYKNIVVAQKKRIDKFFEVTHAASFNEALPYLKDTHYKRIFEQSNIDPFQRKNGYNLFVFDSFAEFVDSKFIHPNGKPFFTVKGDVNIRKLEEAGGQFKGQLSIKEIEEYLTLAFENIYTWHHCPIVYIHYSTKFESRTYYTSRAKQISEIVTRISDKMHFVYSISLDEKKVNQTDSDIFPYHFDLETIKEYGMIIQNALYTL